ncbi:hypothetical protein AABB24_038617, partial [Solanum stoloniferum]
WRHHSDGCYSYTRTYQKQQDSTQRAWISPLMSVPIDGLSSNLGLSNLLSCIHQLGDINNSVTKLMALGAELDGPIKYEIHGKVAALRCVDGHLLGLYEPS